MVRADLIIRNGYIVTMNEKMELIEMGSVVVSDGLIMAIDTTEAIDNEYSSEVVIDATGKIIMPGMINCHTHIPMTYFRGLADDLPLMTWLQDHIWPVEKEFVKPEFVYDAALHGSAEMIRNGITMFNDQYFHGKETAQAALKAGIRCMVGEGILDFPVANYTHPHQIMDYTVEMHKRFAKYDTVDFCMSPHSIYTVSKETLIWEKNFEKKNNLLIPIHVSETEKEVKECLKKYN